MPSIYCDIANMCINLCSPENCSHAQKHLPHYHVLHIAMCAMCLQHTKKHTGFEIDPFDSTLCARNRTVRFCSSSQWSKKCDWFHHTFWQLELWLNNFATFVELASQQIPAEKRTSLSLSRSVRSCSNSDRENIQTRVCCLCASVYLFLLLPFLHSQSITERAQCNFCVLVML